MTKARNPQGAGRKQRELGWGRLSLGQGSQATGRRPGEQQQREGPGEDQGSGQAEVTLQGSWAGGSEREDRSHEGRAWSQGPRSQRPSDLIATSTITASSVAPFPPTCLQGASALMSYCCVTFPRSIPHCPSPPPGPCAFLELCPAWALPPCACAMDSSNPNK